MENCRVLPVRVWVQWAEHLRDDVAGPFDDHLVAGPDVLPVEVLLVVEACALDGDPREVDPAPAAPPG